MPIFRELYQFISKTKTPMTHDTPQPKRRTGKFYQPLAIATLLASGLSQPLLPVLAAGTPFDTNIVNRATASYEDDVNTYDVVSNEVTIQVAEIAGITNVPVSAVDDNVGSVLANDDLTFTFRVTNTGNASTDIYIPGTRDNAGTREVDGTELGLTGLTAGDITEVQFSTDNGANYNPVPANGLIPGVAADAEILVQVLATTPTLAVGTEINVRLGNTGTNDNVEATTQNIPDINPDDAAGGENDDVRTVDDGAAPAGAPVNGEREASALSDSLFYGNAILNQAFAQVTKVASHDAQDATDSSDDEITYTLGLNVLQTGPGSFNEVALEGTRINLENTPGAGPTLVERILIADTIPALTSLQSVDFSALPATWQVVYTTDTPAGGPIESDVDAIVQTDGVTWTVLNSGDAIPAGATRIGFIKDGTVAVNESLTNFRFTVVTDGYADDAASIEVVNMAQVFGQSAGDPDNGIVYDESGDANANNFDGATPGNGYNPTNDASGVATIAADGEDVDNNNTGAGPDGEANVVRANRQVAPGDDIFNGTASAADAVGPTDDNDDFTNLSSALPAGTDVSENSTDTVNPSAVTFTNQVQNPAGSVGPLANVTLEPIAPSQAQANDASALTGLYGADGDIPTGTTVTIDYDPDQDGNLATTDGDELQAVYTYNGTRFTLTGGTRVNIGQLTVGQTQSYNVTVQLPNGQPVLTGYSIPVVAFVDDSTDGFNDDAGNDPNIADGEAINNITIDRVYTGFMEVTKEARIINEEGDVLDATDGSNLGAATNQNLGWAQTFTTNAAPGQFIEYRIQYENISTAAPGSGSNNLTLTARNFSIVEDGDGGANTWGAFTTHQQNTVAAGSVEYLVSGTPTTTEPADGTPSVEQYTNDVGDVAPGSSDRFQFRRVVD